MPAQAYSGASTQLDTFISPQLNSPVPTDSRWRPAEKDLERRPIFRSKRFSPDQELRLRLLAEVHSHRGILAVLEDYLLLGVSAATIAWAVHQGGLALLLMPPAWVLIGARMRAFATLLHEASHKGLAKAPWLNAALGTVASGWWVGQLLSRYTETHVRQHHPRLPTPDLDPDAQQYMRQGLLDQDPGKMIVQNLLIALSGAKTLVNLPYLLRDRLLPKPGEPMSPSHRWEMMGFGLAWFVLLVLLTLTHGFSLFVLIWVVPYFTTFQAINWLIELTEHFPLPWTRGEHFQLTRNRKGPAWERLLFGAHGEGWHRVHHERQYIPFYALSQAHAVMMEDDDYRLFEEESGGLFVRGSTGAPSILAAITAEARRFQAQREGGQ